MPRKPKKPSIVSTGSPILNALLAGGVPAGSLQSVYGSKQAPYVTGLRRGMGVKGPLNAVGVQGAQGHPGPVGMRGYMGVTDDMVAEFEKDFPKQKYRLLEDLVLRMRSQEPGAYTKSEKYSYIGANSIPAGTAVTGAELTKFFRQELSKLHPTFYKWDKNFPDTHAMVLTTDGTLAHLTFEVFEDYGCKPKPKNLFLIMERPAATFMDLNDTHALREIVLDLILQEPPERICKLITTTTVKESSCVLKLMKAILAGHTTPL